MRLEELGPFGFFEWFKDGWLVSRQALKLFRLSTVFVLATIPIFVMHWAPEHPTLWQNLLGGTAGVLGPISIFFLWFGMWRYWFRLDNSPSQMKRTSFILLLIGVWYGAVLYCYFVYGPQVAGRPWAQPFAEAREEQNEAPRWELRKVLYVGFFSIFGFAIVFGLLLRILVTKFFPRSFADDYATFCGLLTIAGIISLFVYLLLRIFRTDMKTRR
jgi:hypothetical protein